MLQAVDRRLHSGVLAPAADAEGPAGPRRLPDQAEGRIPKQIDIGRIVDVRLHHERAAAPDQRCAGMSSRDFASSSIAPMSVDPRKDGSEMTFRMPKSSEDSKTAAESAANPGKSNEFRTHPQAKIRFNDENSTGWSFLPDTSGLFNSLDSFTRLAGTARLQRGQTRGGTMRTGVDFEVSDEQRGRLEAIADGGNSKVKHARRARIILLTDDGLGTMAVADGAGVTKATVWRWQERFMQEGVEGLLRDKTRKPGTPRTSEETVRELVDLAERPAPDGETHWTVLLPG